MIEIFIPDFSQYALSCITVWLVLYLLIMMYLMVLSEDAKLSAFGALVGATVFTAVIMLINALFTPTPWNIQMFNITVGQATQLR